MQFKMLYYKGYTEYRWTILGGSKTVLITFFPSLSLYGCLPKVKYNINEKVRSKTYFFLFYLGEYIFRGSSIKKEKTEDLSHFLL